MVASLVLHYYNDKFVLSTRSTPHHIKENKSVTQYNEKKGNILVLEASLLVSM